MLFRSFLGPAMLEWLLRLRVQQLMCGEHSMKLITFYSVLLVGRGTASINCPGLLG